MKVYCALLYLRFAKTGRNSGGFFVSQRNMSRLLNVSTRTVRQGIERLRDLGYLDYEHNEDRAHKVAKFFLRDEF